MPLKYHDVNPLAVNNMRQMTFCPAHFHTMTIDLIVGQKRLTDWLFENTDGRFYVEQNHAATVKIGFENHYEATVLAMHLPEINSRPEFIL